MVLITGVGSGIGRAGVLLFAAEGARVAVVDCVPAGGQETVAMVKKAGGEATFIEADVSKAADVQRMIRTTVDRYGRVDILWNNAGIVGLDAAVADILEENWDLILDTNLKGAFLGSKYAIPAMLRQGGGVIINTASTQALGASPTIAPYCVSKAGIVMLTKQIASEYTRQNIRANCICPGWILTPMNKDWIPTFRMDFTTYGKERWAGNIARVAPFLASDDSEFMAGASLVVDGGWTAEVKLPLKQLPN